MGVNSLTAAFPSLFNLASDKDATIAEIRKEEGMEAIGFSLVQKTFSGLENDAVIQSLKLIYSVAVQVGVNSLQ